MMKTSIEDLLKALEEIRETKYPDVPKEVIEKVALAQYKNQDNRSRARAETMRIINEYLSGISIEEK